MSNKVIVHKARVNILIVEMGFDISTETYTSQIRSEPDQEGTLIAEWSVDFVTDGVDGKLQLILTDVITGQISQNSGYMDLKRVIPFLNYPVAVFDKPLEVTFRGSVTA